MADSPEPERELDADAASKALSEFVQKRLRGLEPKEPAPLVDLPRKRYIVGPFEDPSEGPRALMSLETALSDLRSRFEEADDFNHGDELTYRIVYLSDAEVAALPEL